MTATTGLGLVPAAVETEIQLGTNAVRLTFEADDGTAYRFILDQPMLMNLVSRLHARLERGPLTPVSLDRVRPGASIQVHGTNVSALPDGGLRIVLLAEMEDRVVTVPFELDRTGAEELKAKLPA